MMDTATKAPKLHRNGFGILRVSDTMSGKCLEYLSSVSIVSIIIMSSNCVSIVSVSNM